MQTYTALTQYIAMDWDDLRYVLAVAREGSALRASRVLRVNQTTVLRRLDALERELGEALFERGRSGQTLTPLGCAAREAAERMEAEAQGFQNALAAHRRSLSGSVRLTTSESLANRFVTPCLRAFQARYPDVSIELIASDRRMDIARGDADVALRAGSRPEGAGIVARRLPDNEWSIYCSRSYAEERGPPRDRTDLQTHEVIGAEGALAALPGQLWLMEAAPEALVRFRSNSMVSLVANLKAGLGVGALPTIIGDAEPDLYRCFPPLPGVTSEMWLIVQERLKGRPHIRAFTDFLAGYIRETVGRPG